MPPRFLPPAVSSHLRALCATALALIAAPSAVDAASVAAWDFSTITSASNWGASPLAPSSSDAHVAVVGLTRNWTCGGGTPAAAAWGGNNFNTSATTETAAIAANNCATFSLTVADGYTLSLSDIGACNVRRSAAGPTTGRWQYQINSGAFTDIGAANITWGTTTTASGNTQPAVPLSDIAALQNLPAGTSVTFRLVTWGATGSSGTWYLNDPTKSSAADFTINGTVAPAASATQVRIETAANGSGSVVPAQNLTAGLPLTVYSVSRDANGGFVANAVAAWSLTALSGGVSAGDLVPAADGKSATFTPGAAGTAVIHAAVSGLASVDSGTLTAVALPTQPTATTAVARSTVLRGNTVVFSVTVVPGKNPASTSLNVVADLSAIGGSPTQTFYDDGSNGDATANDRVFTFKTVVPASISRGTKSLPVSVTDSQGRSASTSLSVTVGSTLTVLHMNDTHARVTPHKWIVPAHDINLNPRFEDVGGAAYLAGKILSLTAANPNALVLDAGDISEGNPIGDMNGNGTMTQFYTLLSQKLKAQRGRGMDAVIVGNHDVRDANYIANMASLAASGVPVLSVNICQKGTHTPYFAASTIVTIDGVKIGILGYTTQASEVGASLSDSIDVVNCDWSSTDSSKIHLADQVKDLRTNQGCDIVILLAHIGHSSLVDPAAPLLVDDGSTKLPEVAVTGHWHTWTDTVWQPAILNYKTIFTESCSYMKYLGELTIDNTGKYVGSVQHVIRDADITPDADVQALIDGFKASYDASHSVHADDVVGYTASDLLLDNKMKWWSADEYPWSGNNTAGQWICDAMQWKAAQLWGACDLSIEAGGGVRSDIPKGAVTFTQIYETFPWNDDTFCLVKMTGQEIVNFLKATNCDAGFSSALDVTAADGVPTAVLMHGSPINPNQSYTVCINNYMYAHPPSGWTWSDTNPQYRNDVLCRDGIVEYMQTQHGTPATAYQSGGYRYHLNTEFAGGFRAVVTMMNDNDSKYTYDDAFIRLLSATPETIARRGTSQVPAALVFSDGSVNPANRLSEAELYRSYLGFKPGALKPGDIIETWGKGSFYDGNPEFVDQEGIYADGVEFKIVGHDDSLAKPVLMPSIASFWNDSGKNHYVKFIAKKAGTSSVVDQLGQTLSISDVTAYAAKSLPGSTGDILVLTGVPTMENHALRFRCDSAVLGSTVGVSSLPSTSTVSSHVNPALPGTTASSISLSATASVNASNSYSLTPTADAQVESGSPSYNGGSSKNLFVASSSTGSYGNERTWLKFDLSSLPAGSSITNASLQLWCWSATGASLATEVHGCTDDSWTESGITWSTQPSFASSALDSQTLAAGTKNLWYSWDVTAFAQGQLSGDKTVSLLVKAATESSTDATAPSYGFDAREYGSNSPVLQVTLASSGPVPTVASVQYFYRYSTDNTSWGPWTSAGSSSTAPYPLSFSFPQGCGYYEFYSRATDSNGSVESAPFAAQAFTHYTAAPLYDTAAIVTLGNLTATYDGSAHAASATTLPSGLNVTFSYDGSATPPTNGGSHNVVATVNQPGFSGIATGTLYIARINQTITFAPLPAKAAGDAPFDLSATASSGLPVSFTSSDPSIASVSGATVTLHGPGTVTITADQAGNSNYSGAPSVSQTLVVSGSASDGGSDVPLPTWALVALAAGLFALAAFVLGKRTA